MPSSRHLIILTVIIAVASIVWMVFDLTRPSDHEGLNRDSYGTQWYGDRGLYELVEALGAPVERALLPIAPSDRRHGVCVMLGPDPALTHGESAYLLKTKAWVERGGTLLLAPAVLRRLDFDAADRRPSDDEPSSNTLQMLRLLGLHGVGLAQDEPIIAQREPTLKDIRRTKGGIILVQPKPAFAPRHVMARGDMAPLRGVVQSLSLPQDGLQRIALAPDDVRAEPLGENPVLRAFGRLFSQRRRDNAPASRPTGTLRADDGATSGATVLLAANFQVGKGRIVLVSDPVLFQNSPLREADNAALAAHLILGRGAPAGKTVLFDEFYHGLTVRGNPFWLLSQFPFGMLAGCIALLWGLWAWRAAMHLGPPLPDPPPARRSMGEYVEAMANVFVRGGCRRFIATEIHAGVLWSMRRKLGLSPDAAMDAIVERLDRRDRGCSAAFKQAMDDLEATIGAGHEPESKALVQTIGKASLCLSTNFINRSAGKSRR